MKTNIFLLISLFLIASCNSDQQAKLNKLRTKQAALAKQIKELENEIAKSDTAGRQNKNALPVMVQELKYAPFNHFIEVQGRLDGDENIGVSPQSPGKITALYVSVGQSVTKGQVLAKLDDAVQQQQLKQYLTNLGFLTEIFEKQKKLWEQKIGSEVQYLTAKTNKEAMEEQVGVIRDQIATLQLVSPINGTVEDINFKVGQVVSINAPVMRLISFNKTKVVADLAEAYASKINVNDRVLIFFPDLNAETNAVINFASRFINPVTRSFAVEAQLREPLKGLKANMVAVLKINDYHNENTLSVPLNLIQKDQTGDFIYVIANNSDPVARKANITIGQTYNGMAEITAGLKAGDRIITVGYQDVKDGKTVVF